jgi:hypothetical protein
VLILISGGAALIEKFDRNYLGGLVTPSGGTPPETYTALGVRWAMDNDCFNGFDEYAFTYKLEWVVKNKPGCLWVVCPDVVCNATATLKLFYEWKDFIRDRGLKVAFVAQNGIEKMPIPWDELDCLFIGGDTTYKLGPEIRQLVQIAKSKDKWVHMGRVNSIKRVKYANSIGCDSVDGTGFSKFGNQKIPMVMPYLK